MGTLRVTGFSTTKLTLVRAAFEASGTQPLSPFLFFLFLLRKNSNPKNNNNIQSN